MPVGFAVTSRALWGTSVGGREIPTVWRWLTGTLLGLLVVGCGTHPPAPDALVTGVAMSRERVVLPPEAVFEATLLDVSFSDMPPVVLGRQRREPAGQPPYPVQIPYPTVRFLPKGRYEVRASVTLEGRLLLSTQMRHPVPQDPAFRRVDVQLKRQPALSSAVEASVPLVLTYWRLVELEEQPFSVEAQGGLTPHLVFQSDKGQATGAGGCNRFLADYMFDGGRLRFRRLVSGITLCLQSGVSEARYFAALEAVESFRQQGAQLLLRDKDGKPLLRFEATETPLS